MPFHLLLSPAAKAEIGKDKNGAKCRTVVLKLQRLLLEQEASAFTHSNSAAAGNHALVLFPVQFGAAHHNLAALTPLSMQFPPQEMLGI